MLGINYLDLRIIDEIAVFAYCEKILYEKPVTIVIWQHSATQYANLSSFIIQDSEPLPPPLISGSPIRVVTKLALYPFLYTGKSL